MIATCTICEKVFVEDAINKSVEQHFEDLSKRLAKHIKLKHPKELEAIGESQANFVGLLVLLQFDSEDAWFNKEKERIREIVSTDVQADFDPFFAGAVAACYYMKQAVSTFDKDKDGAISVILANALEEYQKELATKFEIEDSDIEEYGKALAEEETGEEEEEEEGKKDATEGEQTKL